MLIKQAEGSPPQVRGKQEYRQTQDRETGITPAGAGKTSTASRNQIGTWDHPRRCGENDFFEIIGYVRIGSPPQVRGKRHMGTSPDGRYGITPAGAGKTLLRRHCKHHTQDHPRRCGENAVDYSAVYLYIGSPPQVRGKPCRCTALRKRCRITPAGAGKTFLPLGMSRISRDHPRRCGENHYTCFVRSANIGSPPQVRGKRFTQNWEALRNRITPAGAGKTVV